MPSSSLAEPSSSASTVDEVRQQAGPLPSKLGEIGYREQPGQASSVQRETDSFPALPARHPADRDPPPPSSTDDDPNPPPPSRDTDSSSSSTYSGKSSILSFFKHKNFPTYFAIGLASWIVLSIHIIFLAGTVALWVYSAQRLNKFIFQQTGSGGGGTSAIFVHVIFAIFVTGQLLFLERRIFRLRAERYMHLHQGEMLPTHNASGHAYMGFAPWNRPPLPTYAAALAQSGVGTGDVEDHLIAAVPPPAYGNTRGSRLLLSGFLRESLRAQRPQSQGSQRSERPLSYVSREEGWEEVRDSERAHALATLENAHVRS